MTKTLLPAAVLVLAASAASAQVAADQWGQPDALPFHLFSGGRMVQTDADTLYFTAGTSNVFRKYTISTKVTTTLNVIPVSTGAAASMAWMPGTNFIYLAVGANTTAFYRCDITGGGSVWSAALAVMPFVPNNGNSLVAAGTKLYWTAGSNGTSGTAFYEYQPPELANPPLGTWTVKTPTPTTQLNGGCITYPGGDFIYGCNQTNIWRHALNFPNAASQALGTWVTLTAAIPEAVDYGGALTPISPTALLLSTGSNNNDRFGFYRFDINPGAAAGGSWVQLADRPGQTGPYSSLAWLSGDLVYATRNDPGNSSGATADLWRYSISTNRWVGLAVPPGMSHQDAAIIGVGDGDTLYRLQGFNRVGFSKYSIASDTWTTLAPVPGLGGNGMSVGTCMAWAGGDYIYAMGLNTAYTTLLRYSIGQNKWEGSNDPMPFAPSAPVNVVTGAALVWTGGNDLVLFPGGNASTYRFTIPTGLWSAAIASPPGALGAGASATWDRADGIYVLRGGNTNSFYVYSISRNLWNVKADASPWTPQVFGDNAINGATICYPGVGRHIFALSGYITGTTTNRFWSYQLPDTGTPAGLWVQRAAAPGTARDGSSLASPGSGKFLYASQGTWSRKLWSYWMISDPPANPTTLSQWRIDGVTPMQGTTTAEAGFTAKALVTDPYGDKVRLVVEVKAAAAPFDGLGLVSGNYVASGTLATVTVPTGLTPGDWKWRVLTQDDKGYFSPAPVDFGAAAGTDFTVRANAAPTMSALKQVQLSGAVVAVGGGFFVGEDFRLQAPSITDADPLDMVKLEVEIQKLGTIFTGTPTATGVLFPNGGAAFVQLDLDEGSYHWQGRPADEWNKTAPAWAPFGSNPESQADFIVYRAGSMNEATSACAARPSGLPVAALGLFLIVLLRPRPHPAPCALRRAAP